MMELKGHPATFSNILTLMIDLEARKSISIEIDRHIPRYGLSSWKIMLGVQHLNQDVSAIMSLHIHLPCKAVKMNCHNTSDVYV